MLTTLLIAFLFFAIRMIKGINPIEANSMANVTSIGSLTKKDEARPPRTMMLKYVKNKLMYLYQFGDMVKFTLHSRQLNICLPEAIDDSRSIEKSDVLILPPQTGHFAFRIIGFFGVISIFNT